MLRFPLSFFGAADPLPAALAAGADALVPGLPIQAAAIGTAAAAAAPLSSVRLPSFRSAPSSISTLPRAISPRLCARFGQGPWRVYPSPFRPLGGTGADSSA